ncbi:uncharacterized protein BNAC03G36520D isoform X1 [Brassica napus]|uniref:uncharacterized protein BNAC03G36520D isoform X1 n=1 Tax=Brassica napus TaxID=3708 RepID=UPI00207AFF7D|nr:uncharacterized protein BNAC03G36520D isoform X1 [Brassica napus]
MSSSSLLRFGISRPSSSYKKLVSSHFFGFATSSLSWANNTPHHTKLKQKQKQKLRVKGSAQEIPQTLEEDSKFVPLDPQDPVFGPPVLLLLGFQIHEAQKVIYKLETELHITHSKYFRVFELIYHLVMQIQELLKELDGEFMKIMFCTEDMIPRSLWEAVNTRQTDLKRVKIAESLPRICFLSGLTGEEMMMFIDAFPETGLEPAVFAAMVPNSADKPISELMEEIMGDHELLTGSGSSSGKAL